MFLTSFFNCSSLFRLDRTTHCEFSSKYRYLTTSTWIAGERFTLAADGFFTGVEATGRAGQGWRRAHLEQQGRQKAKAHQGQTGSGHLKDLDKNQKKKKHTNMFYIQSSHSFLPKCTLCYKEFGFEVFEADCLSPTDWMTDWLTMPVAVCSGRMNIQLETHTHARTASGPKPNLLLQCHVMLNIGGCFKNGASSQWFALKIKVLDCLCRTDDLLLMLFS